MKFELDRLTSYDAESMLEEIRRVAVLVPAGPLTREGFRKHSKVSASAIVRRLGGWRTALELAGLGRRYSGRTVSERMRDQRAKRMSEDVLVGELRSVARKLGSNFVTMEQFTQHSRVNAAVVKKRFGSWKHALERAGLHLSPRGRRYSEDEYFENLLTVWTHYGRQPRYREMNVVPSRIPAGAYETKWGTWRAALLAFIGRVNEGGSTAVVARPATAQPSSRPTVLATADRSPRKLPLSARYAVLKRDGFRCVTCGRSPAVTTGLELHVDHVIPVAGGGTNDVSNLRCLCSECNIGKSDTRA